jgi:ABC-type sugar transport system ATPase subunit
MGRPAMNTIDGIVESGVFRAGDINLPVPGRPDGPAVVGIRPEQIEIVDESAVDAVTLPLDVQELVEPDTLLIIQNAGGQITVRTQTDLGDLERGTPIRLRLRPEVLHFFDTVSGERLL